MAAPKPVLRVGDRISFDGDEHQVLGLAGTTVRLRSDAGGEQVLLAGHLITAPDFAVLDSASLPAVEPFGLLDSLPDDVVADAERWRAHLVEVESGLPPEVAPGTVARPGYDPATTTLADRQRTKAAELGVGVRTIERNAPASWSRGCGVWLTSARPARSTSRPRRRAPGRGGARGHRGRDGRLDRHRVTADAARGQAGGGTARRRGDAAAGQDRVLRAGGSACRRQARLRLGGDAAADCEPAGQGVHPDAGQPPGEQVQIDSTPIDVLVLSADGTPVRADLTIAVDVGTRTICAAVLRPVGTKAVDASLLLAKMLVPEPVRPGWAEALRMSASRLPHQRLVDIDARMREAAARPVIVPDQVVIDHGRVFVSETFTRACGLLGISIQPAQGHPDQQGRGRGDVRRDQDAVRPALRRVQGRQRRAARPRRRRRVNAGRAGRPARRVADPLAAPAA